MPTYEYKCNNCGFELEVFQGLKDPVKKKCQNCNKNKLERLISSCVGFVKEIKTLGQFAEKNTKKLGSKLDTPEEKLRLERKARTREYNEINRMTPEQQMKWVRNG